MSESLITLMALITLMKSPLRGRACPDPLTYPQQSCGAPGRAVGHQANRGSVPFNIPGKPEKAKCCGKEIGVKEPEIIPPTWNKGQNLNSPVKVWKQAAKELSEAKEIIVIGYSLPESDLFFRYLFALGTDSTTRIERFIVCNPDIKVKEKFEKIIGRGIESRFEFYPFKMGVAINCFRGIGVLNAEPLKSFQKLV
ncbi:MAG: hypothetical protein NTW14_13970 [bacterium]|nr:hypothetical protein [bacterium]